MDENKESMQQEMLDVIKKNLPAHVGDVLKERLAQADNDAARVKSLNQQLDSKKERIQELEKIVNDYKALDERNNGLEKREKDVQEAERNVKTATLEFQLSSEKDKSQFAKDVALGLVRNTTYRDSVFDSHQVGDRYIDNKYHQGHSETKSHIVEKKAE